MEEIKQGDHSNKELYLFEESSMKCTLCFVSYDPDAKRPLILTCGHTFCK